MFSFQNDLSRFHILTRNCNQELCYKNTLDFVSEFQGRQNRSKLRDFIRCFHFELLWKEVRGEIVSVETENLNEQFCQNLFIVDSTQSTQSSSAEQTFIKFKTIQSMANVGIRQSRYSENLFPMEEFTCNMSPLRVESRSSYTDSEDIYIANTIPDDGSQRPLSPCLKEKEQTDITETSTYKRKVNDQKELMIECENRENLKKQEIVENSLKNVEENQPLIIETDLAVKEKPSTSRGFNYFPTPPRGFNFLVDSSDLSQSQNDSPMSVYAQEVNTNDPYDENADVMKYKSFVGEYQF